MPCAQLICWEGKGHESFKEGNINDAKWGKDKVLSGCVLPIRTRLWHGFQSFRPMRMAKSHLGQFREITKPSPDLCSDVDGMHRKYQPQLPPRWNLKLFPCVDFILFWLGRPVLLTQPHTTNLPPPCRYINNCTAFPGFGESPLGCMACPIPTSLNKCLRVLPSSLITPARSTPKLYSLQPWALPPTPCLKK